jgi:DNA polymerase-3 subunit delta
MPEINYQSVKEYIHERLNSSFDPVYLIYGEEFLYHQITQSLVKAIIPDPAHQKHNFEVINHKEESQLAEVIERMNTYSFFSEKKIMELRDATVFVASHNQGNVLEKVKQLFGKNDFEKASNLFLNLLSRLQICLSDISDDISSDMSSDISGAISDAAIADKFNISEDQAGDIEWIKKLCSYCQERKLSVPESGDDAQRLKNAIEKGFPKNNFLFITTDTVDKRKALYKTIKKLGTVIDCAIPKGNRKADQDAQRRFLQQHMRQFLRKYNKQIDSKAFELMIKMTGFDLRAFNANLEKLVDYAKDREHITPDDVQAVLIRTRQDPIYELTGALSDRDTLKTLHYMSSLLSSGFHYLQILTAMTNQIRKLLVIKGFLESKYGSDWHPGIAYDQFKQIIIPLIVKYDEELIEMLACYQNALKGKFESQELKKQKNPSTDLMIAKNPNNPYPVFQQFFKSKKYTKEDLFAAFEILSHADVKLKTSGQPPISILEEVVFKICGDPDSHH